MTFRKLQQEIVSRETKYYIDIPVPMAKIESSKR